MKPCKRLKLMSSISNWNCIGFLLLVIVAVACGEDDGSSQPQPPAPGNIEITIETDGKDDDPDGYVVLVDGSSMETDPNGTYLVENKSPGSYSVELTEIPVHCEGDGEMVRQVTVTEDGTVQVAYKVTCEAILRNKVLYIKGPSFGPGFGIYKMDYNGENEELIYNQGLTHGTTLAISPEGTAVYFNASGPEGSRIFRMAADGESVEEVFEGTAIGEISLSPDGSKLAFRMGIEMDIYVYILETGELAKITNEPEIQFSSPSWSPDGSKILVTRQDPESDIGVSVWEMKENGTELAAFLSDPEYAISSAKLSPVDDDAVIFQANYLLGQTSPREIYLADKGLNDRKNISADIQGQVSSNSTPVWSQDGGTIFFISQYDFNRSHIYKFETEGSILSQLTTQEALHLNPAFSPIVR